MNSSMLRRMPTKSCLCARCEFALVAGQIWSVHLPEGARVGCVRGVIWLTQSDDATDFVLRAGESFVASRCSHVVVQVMDGQDAILENVEK